MRARGLLLAAGAGRRMGGPKALQRNDNGLTWVEVTTARMLAAGCDDVLVVLGAQAEQAREVLQASALPGVADVATVTARDWDEGMSASLHCGLQTLSAATESTTHDAALVMLVDLPDINEQVLRRVLKQVDTAAGGADVLARAAFHGTPGHPVLIGSAHWAGVSAGATHDRGARTYLSKNPVQLIECGDLATGADQDTPARVQ